jgi:hypothetical protein
VAGDNHTVFFIKKSMSTLFYYNKVHDVPLLAPECQSIIWVHAERNMFFLLG